MLGVLLLQLLSHPLRSIVQTLEILAQSLEKVKSLKNCQLTTNPMTLKSVSVSTTPMASLKMAVLTVPLLFLVLLETLSIRETKA